MQRLTRRKSDDPKVMKKKADIAGWYTGGNSTCRRHNRSSHYPEYKRRCEEGGIEEDWQAVPKHILAERKVKEEAEKGKSGSQSTLDGVVVKVQGPKAFSREGILDAVTRHVVCGDQVCHIHTPSLARTRPEPTGNLLSGSRSR